MGFPPWDQCDRAQREWSAHSALVASSVLSPKYGRKCASGIGDLRTYISPENEIATLSLLCDIDIRATSDDQAMSAPDAVVTVGP